jgi:hypothetical protein
MTIWGRLRALASHTCDRHFLPETPRHAGESKKLLFVTSSASRVASQPELFEVTGMVFYTASSANRLCPTMLRPLQRAVSLSQDALLSAMMLRLPITNCVTIKRLANLKLVRSTSLDLLN